MLKTIFPMLTISFIIYCPLQSSCVLKYAISLKVKLYSICPLVVFKNIHSKGQPAYGYTLNALNVFKYFGNNA